jgi:UPF0755 protein
MKKTILIILAVLVLIAAFFGWKIAGPGTNFTNKVYTLYIKTGSTFNDVAATLEKDNVVNSNSTFNFISNRLNYPAKVKAGRYDIKKGSSILSIVRMLRNGTQTPVNLVITKLRTKENLASLIGRKFECDSAAVIKYLNSNDSLSKYGLDSNTAMTMIFPNTYTFYWNTGLSKIIAVLQKEQNSFWNSSRISKAKEKGLTPEKAYILASIVEEETNASHEKGTIASVYLNRMAKGMRLGADPTVKFALKDFGLKRIYYKHLAVASPYNTYRVAGLPPGPICTPAAVTIDAVLNAPTTDYLYFVASSQFNGTHNFAATYEAHLKLAKEYQQALDKLMNQKKANEQIDSN